MERKAIFGPYKPDHPQYNRAFSTVNDTLRTHGVLVRERGADAVLYQGELPPEAEAPFIKARTQPQKTEKPQKAEKPKPKKARRSNYGRWEMLNNWVDYGQHYFSTTAGRVWLAIFRMADGNTNVLEFSVRTLANKAGVTNKATQKAVAAFVEAGVLVCIFRSKKKGTPSKYRLADATNELTRRPSKPR